MTIEGFLVVLFGYSCFALLIGCLVGRFLHLGTGTDVHTVPSRTVEDELDEIAWNFPKGDIAHAVRRPTDGATPLLSAGRPSPTGRPARPTYNEQRPAGRPGAA